MNFKNLAENLIIIIIVGILGAYIGYTASTKANKQVLEAFMPLIQEEFKKETTKIENSFKTEIKKLKTKKGETEIRYTPDLTNILEVKKDTITPVKTKEIKKRKKFLGIF